jgi:hypothetical protein
MKHIITCVNVVYTVELPIHVAVHDKTLHTQNLAKVKTSMVDTECTKKQCLMRNMIHNGTCIWIFILSSANPPHSLSPLAVASFKHHWIILSSLLKNVSWRKYIQPYIINLSHFSLANNTRPLRPYFSSIYKVVCMQELIYTLPEFESAHKITARSQYGQYKPLFFIDSSHCHITGKCRMYWINYIKFYVICDYFTLWCYYLVG